MLLIIIVDKNLTLFGDAHFKGHLLQTGLSSLNDTLFHVVEGPQLKNLSCIQYRSRINGTIDQFYHSFHRNNYSSGSLLSIQTTSLENIEYLNRMILREYAKSNLNPHHVYTIRKCLVWSRFPYLSTPLSRLSPLEKSFSALPATFSITSSSLL